jgi:hypothetical protein
MTLEQLKTEAVKVNDIKIQWEQVTADEKHEREFVHALELACASIPGLEYIYTMLSGGHSALPVDEQETVIEQCADELFAAYQLQEVLQRYKMILEITEVVSQK